MSSLAVDYSFSRPDPARIHAAGYHGVLRYLTGRGKAVSKAEVAALHRAGLWVAVCWETSANRATQGFKAGVADRKAAEKAAKALGYPSQCPIFYTVDGDYSPKQVVDYFAGIRSVNGSYPPGVYGSFAIVEAHPHMYGWQTEAWSGTQVSGHANLYQRVRATVAHPVPGTDENVILKGFPVWVPHPATVKPPAPVQPQPHPANPDHDLLAAFDKWKSAKGLTG